MSTVAEGELCFTLFLLQTQLEILQKYAEMKDENHDYSRALAFRRASCVVKSFPVTVTNVNQLNGINHVGPHSKRVIGVSKTIIDH